MKLPEEVAKKYTVAPKVAAVFVCNALGGITINLEKVSMPMADKLAALEPPILLPLTASKKDKEDTPDVQDHIGGRPRDRENPKGKKTSN